MKNNSNKIVEKIKAHILRSVTFSENRALYETMSKYMVEPDRPQTIGRMRVEYWISKAARAQADAHSLKRARARTHAHVCALSNTELCNNFCFPTATVV
jgi:hypothetical protein